jgi:uncharacterized protein YxeA
MKKILDILIFITSAIHAITMGAKIANENWPSDNPFSKSDSGGVAKMEKQSGDTPQ